MRNARGAQNEFIASTGKADSLFQQGQFAGARSFYLNFASCFASCRPRMNSQAKSGIRLKATNHPLGDNYRAKFRFYQQALSIFSEGEYIKQQMAECARLLAVAPPENKKPPTAPPAKASHEGMALLPAGKFLLGSERGEEDEKPPHKAYVDALFMDKEERLPSKSINAS